MCKKLEIQFNNLFLDIIQWFILVNTYILNRNIYTDNSFIMYFDDLLFIIT